MESVARFVTNIQIEIIQFRVVIVSETIVLANDVQITSFDDGPHHLNELRVRTGFRTGTARNGHQTLVDVQLDLVRLQRAPEEDEDHVGGEGQNASSAPLAADVPDEIVGSQRLGIAEQAQSGHHFAQCAFVREVEHAVRGPVDSAGDATIFLRPKIEIIEEFSLVRSGWLNESRDHR